MSDTLVTVLIPSRRSDYYLKDALDSLKKQTHKNWEAIIYDTSKEHGALDVVSALGLSENITVIEGEFHDDAGANSAHSLLYDHWSGEGYGCWLHDDDLLPNNSLELRVEYLDNNKECDIVFGGFMVISKRNNSDVFHLQGGLNLPKLDEYGFKLNAYVNPAVSMGHMWKADIREIPRKYLDGYYTGINDTLNNMLMYAWGFRLARIDKCVYLWRRHGVDNKGLQESARIAREKNLLEIDKAKRDVMFISLDNQFQYIYGVTGTKPLWRGDDNWLVNDRIFSLQQIIDGEHEDADKEIDNSEGNYDG